MSEQDDKAKKLREIQDRLNEIQKNSPVPKPGPQNTMTTPRPVPPVPSKESQSPIAARDPERTETIPAAAKQSAKVDEMTQEERNWRANKLKQEQESKTKSKTQKNPGIPKSPLSLSRIFTLVSLLVTILVCSYLAYNFLSGEQQTDVPESELPPGLHDETETGTLENDENQQEEIQTTESAELSETEKTQVAEKQISAEKAKVIPVKERNLTPPAAEKPIKKAEQSVPSGVIISYASNSTEDKAVSNVNSLLSKGFAAKYYFMPDKDPGSPALYKVYLGPYKDESAAMADFKKIVALNDKAFISMMK